MKKSHCFVFLLVLLVSASGFALGAALPEPGTDKFDAVVEMTVARFGPDPVPFRLFLTGPVVVQRGAPQMTAHGTFTIATEIVSMHLTGPDLVLGPDPSPFRIELTLNPSAKSLGQIHTAGRTLENATSFFDVFLQLNIGTRMLSNTQPLHLQTMIDPVTPISNDAFPPIETAYLATNLPVDLGGASLQDIKFVPAEPSHSTLIKQTSVVESLLAPLPSVIGGIEAQLKSHEQSDLRAFQQVGQDQMVMKGQLSQQQNQLILLQNAIGQLLTQLQPLLPPPSTTTVTVSGYVTNKANNAPLPGYEVFAAPFPDPTKILSPNSITLKTAANGFYSFTVPKGSAGFVFVTPPTICSVSSPLTVFQVDVQFNFQICP